MTERERNLSTADIAETKRDETGELDDADRPLGRDQDAGKVTAERELEPLLAPEDAQGFRDRWESIQTRFVDEPRQAVEDADRLVAELMQQLAQTFNEERESLEAQLGEDEQTSTEDLRIGLQRYRSFFVRLLKT
jgi:hypothetical protein